MGKKSVPKPQEVSQATIDAQKKTLGTLQKRLVKTNKRNMRAVKQLASTQQTQFEQATQQISLLQQAAMQQAAPEPELDPAIVQGTQSMADMLARSQSDSIMSRATAEQRMRSQQERYKRNQLISAVLRNRQVV